MPTVQNPILPGFHPDPSICRVGDTYYLATSTFEWWPGVRLHRSRDLAHWEPIGGALTRRSQLDMRGNPDSGGVWAPALSHADGRFWLVYSDVKAFDGPVKDLRNYLVTAEDPAGPWSEPVSLNASGFDPSLFHAPDGRKYLLNQLWLPRADVHPFAGVVLQEYDPVARRLVGPVTNIFTGTSLQATEGPHLLYRDNHYWLIVAEGGTGLHHAVTVARSRDLLGPYEVHPDNPLLTSRDQPALRLQKAGHASFVDTPAGDWYLVHLCSRPLGSPGRSILGRETALQRLHWPVGGWPRLAHGGRAPADQVEVPGPPGPARPYLDTFADDFAAPALHPHWNTLREPPDARWLSLSARPGWLRLQGRHSLHCAFDQSLVACRLLHHAAHAEVTLDFTPTSPLQRAGLALFYDTRNFACLQITADADGCRHLRLQRCDNRHVTELLPAICPLPPSGPVRLSVTLRGLDLQFAFSPAPDHPLAPVGPALHGDFLGDEHPNEAGLGWAFTGAFIALNAQDSSDAAPPADFTGFRYAAG